MPSGSNKAIEAKSKKSEPPIESPEAADKKSVEEIARAWSDFPLFFSRPVAVNNQRCAEAGIDVKLMPLFARATNSIPVNAFEPGEAAKYYRQDLGMVRMLRKQDMRILAGLSG